MGTVLLACMLFASSGCSSSFSTVKGKIEVNGKPLPAGSVSIQSATGVIFDGVIQPDGSYSVENVPVGQAKVLVSSLDDKFADKMNELAGRGKTPPAGGKVPAGRSTAPKGKSAVDSANYSRIDTMYNNYDTSGLTVEVKGSITQFDMKLNK